MASAWSSCATSSAAPCWCTSSTAPPLEPGRDPLSDLETIEAELAAYDDAIEGRLADRPRLVALNKIDVPDARELADLVRADVEERFGFPVFEISAATHEGLRELGFAMAERVQAARAAEPPQEADPHRAAPVRPRDTGFSVEPTGEQAFTVHGDRPRRWVLQTDFTNDEAVGYLADRLARLGVEDALADLGARAGAEVTIGEVTFDWEPTLSRRRGGAARRPGSSTSGSRRAPGCARTSGEAAHDVRRFGEAPDEAAPRRRRPCRRRGMSRAVVASARRLVVKVGSSSLASPTGGLDVARLDALVDALAARAAGGSQIVLVSSGAIAAGLKPLGRRPPAA